MKNEFTQNITETCTTDENYCQIVADAICNSFKSGAVFIQLTNELNDNLWFMIYGILSSILNLLFASLIWRHKQLQVHPMRLMMWIAIVDSFYFSNQFFITYACLFRLPELLIWTT
jgi:hypothetical protein